VLSAAAHVTQSHTDSDTSSLIEVQKSTNLLSFRVSVSEASGTITTNDDIELCSVMYMFS